jgi:hypothetical protein
MMPGEAAADGLATTLANSTKSSGSPTSSETRSTGGIPYDDALLERSRTQWQFGDWLSLARLTREKVDIHPERCKLALLVAAAHQQMDNLDEVRSWVRLAKSWGVSSQLASRILIAGVYQTLGRAALIAQDKDRAEKWLHQAVSTGMPGADARLWRKVRQASAIEQLQKDIREPLFATESKFPPSSKVLLPDRTASVVPRLIICHGMVRSGSTVVLNIVCDLLSACGVGLVKYYISDFPSFSMLHDHVMQNEKTVFIIKTHRIESELASLVESVKGKYLYTKRNLMELSASFVRMTKIPESPFYRNQPVSLDDLLAMLRTQMREYRLVKTLTPSITLDCRDLSEGDIRAVVWELADYLCISPDSETLEAIANRNSRARHVNLSNSIKRQDLTSKGHDKKTFFHAGHVTEYGTSVEDYVPRAWQERITAEFGGCEADEMPL